MTQEIEIIRRLDELKSMVMNLEDGLMRVLKGQQAKPEDTGLITKNPYVDPEIDPDGQ